MALVEANTEFILSGRDVYAVWVEMVNFLSAGFYMRLMSDPFILSKKIWSRAIRGKGLRHPHACPMQALLHEIISPSDTNRTKGKVYVLQDPCGKGGQS